MRAQQHRRADQRAGLVDMHEFQFGQRQRLADAGKIDSLPAGHAARTGGCCQQPDHFQLAQRVFAQTMFREQLERQCLQAVTDQQRGRLVILDMAGRLAAAQHIVVHARHVVMHQRIGVDQLDRGGGDIDAR